MNLIKLLISLLFLGSHLTFAEFYTIPEVVLVGEAYTPALQEIEPCFGRVSNEACYLAFENSLGICRYRECCLTRYFENRYLETSRQWKERTCRTCLSCQPASPKY